MSQRKMSLAMRVFHTPLWRGFAGAARAVLPSSLVKWLRGDFKSMSGRLYSRYELLQLYLHRLKGGRNLDWYAERMDNFVTAAPVDVATFRKYHDCGADDLETLKVLDLTPSTRLQEFVCGFLRRAHYFIEFLNRGKFSGNDSSGERAAIRRGGHQACLRLWRDQQGAALHCQ